MICPLVISLLAISSVSSNRDHLGQRYWPVRERDDGDYGDVILKQSYYIDTDRDQYSDVSFNEIDGSSDTKSNLELQFNTTWQNEDLDYLETDEEKGNFTETLYDEYYDDYNGTLYEDEEFEEEIVVPVAQIISIAPAGFEESPLNVTFEAVGGEVNLGDNTTVSVDEEDITVAVVQKVKVKAS